MRSSRIALLCAGVVLAIAAARMGAGVERYEYGGLAEAIRAGHGLAVPAPGGGWRPSAFVEPAYPALLAALEGMLRERAVVALFLAQLAALAGAAALIARVASPRLRVREDAVFAVVALWPPSLVLALGVNPHAFRLLLLGGLLLAADRKKPWLFGALAGACVWVRGLYLVVALVLGVMALRGRARAIALAVAIAVAAPWTIRNAVAFHRFVPLTTNGGLNLAMGNHPGASGEVDDAAREGAVALLADVSPGSSDDIARAERAREGNAAISKDATEPEVDALLRNAALAWMASHPFATVALWLRKLAMLIGVHPHAGAQYPMLLWLGYLAFALVTAAPLAAGVRLAPRESHLLLVPALALLATFAVFAIDQRYRFEADALLAPFAVAGAPPLWRWIRSLRRRVSWRAPAAIAGAFVSVLLGAPLGDPSLVTRALVVRDDPAPVDAVFVFSGDVDFHRTLAGAREFQERGARWFVVSGAGSGGDSAEEMKRAAMAAGIPASAILVEPNATSTRENVTLSAPLLADHEIAHIAVITSATHSLRATLAARRAWPHLTVISRPTADDDPADCPITGWEKAPRCRSGVAQEWEKLLGYLLRGWL